MKTKRFVWAALASLGMAGCVSFGPEKKVFLPPDAVLLDVRRVDECAASPVKKAVCVPHLEIDARIGAVVPCKTTPVFVFCRSGKRAGLAIEAMKKLGYTDLTNLGGAEDVRKTVVGADE